MHEFVRRLDGVPDIDTYETDLRLSDWRQDGFSHDPFPLPWADYRKLKTILMKVLGSRIFEVLYRSDSGIDSLTFKQAASILMHHVSRFEPTHDLQSSLICNALALRSNISHRQRSAVFADVSSRIDRCMFPTEYAARIREQLFDKGVLDSKWWTQVNY